MGRKLVKKQVDFSKYLCYSNNTISNRLQNGNTEIEMKCKLCERKI